jgi:hypothetical protein
MLAPDLFMYTPFTPVLSASVDLDHIDPPDESMSLLQSYLSGYLRSALRSLHWSYETPEKPPCAKLMSHIRMKPYTRA